MSKKSSYTPEAVISLLEDPFAVARPHPNSLRIPGFDNALRSSAEGVTEYVRALMMGHKDSPLFQFCATANFKKLPEGDMKWVGFIPWGLKEEDTRRLIEAETVQLTVSEKKRLGLEDSLVPRLRDTIRNGLIAILHDNLKESKDVEAINPNLKPNGNMMNNTSYRNLELAVEGSIREAEVSSADPMLILLEKLGFVESEMSNEQKNRVLAQVEAAKLEAIQLYKDLGSEILEGQKEAGIPGDYAVIDLRIEDSWEPYFEFLKKAFGLNGHHSEDGKDEYEAQAIAHLTYLLLRLRANPIMRIREHHGPGVNRRFIKEFYSRIGAKTENKRKKFVALSANGSFAGTGDEIKNYAPLDCYETQIEGFEDLPSEKKEIVRGNFRLKDKISIFIKTLIKRQRLKEITDIDAGEVITININESDLEDSNPTKDRLIEFMYTLAKEAVSSFSTNLVEAPNDVHYTKIPRGTYKLENKLQKDPRNTESFNFPAMKAYINLPIDDVNDPEASIRVEFRVLCGDTYLRGEHNQASRSHHSHYKRKQAIELLRIISPRAYNSDIHKVAKEHKRWSKRQEQDEILEIRSRREASNDKPIIVSRTSSPHSSSPAAPAPQG